VIATEKDYGNRFQICRINAGYTQERAAELIPTSVSSLQDYESGKRIPPHEIVERMTKIYQTPYLGYWYLRETTSLGKTCMPEIIEAITPGDMAHMAVVAERTLPAAVTDIIDAVPKLALDMSNVVRGLARVIRTASGDRKIPITLAEISLELMEKLGFGKYNVTTKTLDWNPQGKNLEFAMTFRALMANGNYRMFRMYSFTVNEVKPSGFNTKGAGNGIGTYQVIGMFTGRKKDSLPGQISDSADATVMTWLDSVL